ncbi:isopentenyl transferase family protein [Wenjunlia tyrosinilytica]|uniref:isopentenyl transferase family protein n=1 Tax=Wenjunlia tyrosinilytica TaxID=1544741 RepID=UPI001663C0EE
MSSRSVAISGTAGRTEGKTRIRRDLHLVLGPTGVGKTARSVQLASRYACPVVVLDRVQCHPRLAVGSGRPTARELRGTPRLYLDDRPVAQGVISAPEAVDRLMEALKRMWDRDISRVVLEGGSISILEELFRRPDWASDCVVAAECWGRACRPPLPGRTGWRTAGRR